MPDMSLTEMLYYLLEYSKDGMSIDEIEKELLSNFAWTGSVSTLENELKGKKMYYCTGDKWKVRQD